MSHIFISYVRQDQEFASRLVDDLLRAGLDIWFDQKNILPDETYDVAVERALHEASTVAVIISPDSMASDDIRQDINVALGHDQRVVPILHRLAPVFPALWKLNWIDLSTDRLYRRDLKKLVESLKGERPSEASDASIISGISVDAALGRVVVPDSTHSLSQASLKRYRRVLGVIAAPYADDGGTEPPRVPLDPHNLWRKLVDAVLVAGKPVALSRLLPPTIDHLAKALTEAYAIVHLIGYAGGDRLDLEDEWGHTAPAFPQALVNVFRGAQTQLVFLPAGFSPTLAELLVEETPVGAVILSQTTDLQITNFFTRRFYTHLDESVRDAFQAALDDYPVAAEHFTLLFEPGFDDLYLEEVNPNLRPLVDGGLPPSRNVPINLDFVGQRAPLSELTREIASTDYRQIATYGLSGIGKSWLVAEYVARSSWRYPDGVLWMHVSAQTKSEDVIGQLIALLELPGNTNWATLRDILRERSVLVVLDQADEWLDPLEISELADFIARLDHVGGSRILLTGWGPIQPLTYTSSTEENWVGDVPPDEAERLARRLIADHGLEAVFSDQTTIDRLVERTLGLPWLIREGVQLVRLNDLETALEDLDELTSDVSDVFEYYMDVQLRRLPEQPLHMLRRLLGLPDGFDQQLALVGGESDARQHLRELLRHNVLRREGRLYYIPTIVRGFLRETAPLSETEQDQVDEIMIKHMLRR